MSEKLQKTAAGIHRKMVAYYGSRKHKHNRDHLQFGTPVEATQTAATDVGVETIEGHTHWTSKKLLDFKNRKTRKRLAKGQFH